VFLNDYNFTKNIKQRLFRSLKHAAACFEEVIPCNLRYKFFHHITFTSTYGHYFRHV